MKQFGPFALRIGIGGLFLTMGIMKLMNPAMITGMLGNLGFPAAAFWAWILIIVEIVGGASVLTGFKLKWVTPFLAVVLVVAIATGNQPIMALTNAALLSGLVSLWLSGPGAWALDKK